MQATRLQRGDTLIEVMVTGFILALGALGAASMQITSLKNINMSNNNAFATQLAVDMSERLRGNADEALLATNPYLHTTSAQPASSLKDCEKVACSTTELATFDKSRWWGLINSNVPAGTGQVAHTNGSRAFTITVRWDNDRSGSSGQNCPKLSEVDMDCYQLVVTL